VGKNTSNFDLGKRSRKGKKSSGRSGRVRKGVRKTFKLMKKREAPDLEGTERKARVSGGFENFGRIGLEDLREWPSALAYWVATGDLIFRGGKNYLERTSLERRNPGRKFKSFDVAKQ